MARAFIEYSPDQGFLLPPNPRDWLPSDNLAYQVLDLVTHLDVTLLYDSYSADGRGAPAFRPEMMLSVIMYGTAKHVYSCRGLKLLCIEDVGARYLCGGYVPDHRTINQFRKRHGKALHNLFVQSVRLCQEAGLVGLLGVAIDGTKIPGRASKDTSMTYAQIVAQEAKIEAEVAELLARADEQDAADDANLGPDNDGLSSLPTELGNRQKRLEALGQAKAALEARNKARQEALKEDWDKAEPRKRPHRKAPDPDNAKPEADDRYNRVDPDSRMMKAKGRYIQGFNAQASADSANQVIVACGVTNDGTDYSSLVPQVEQTIANVGQVPGQIMADAGYYSQRNIEQLTEKGHRVLVPPDNKWQRDRTVSTPLTENEFKTLTVKEQQHHLVTTEEGRMHYALRFKTIEPVFGQIKGCPGHSGFTHFARCGLTKCQEDWNLVCAVHNMMKLIRHRLKKQSNSADPKRVRRSRTSINVQNLVLAWT